jgi:hypothetical protein
LTLEEYVAQLTAVGLRVEVRREDSRFSWTTGGGYMYTAIRDRGAPEEGGSWRVIDGVKEDAFSVMDYLWCRTGKYEDVCVVADELKLWCA